GRERQVHTHSLFRKMGDAGLLGVDKPVEFGGSGLDFSYAMVCAESLGLVNGGSVPMGTGVQISVATPALARYGSDELRREFLAPAISGDYVACLGVSETGAGSDVASIKTTARRVGGDWVINGGKMWTTNGAQADWMCLLANTGDGAAHKNKSLIVVPMKTNGINIAKKLDKLRMPGTDVTMLASMAKLKAGRLRREVSDACLQYWGGAGYLWDNPVARSYRDGRLGSIGGGADEVMLQIISKLMGALPRLGNR